MGQLIEGEFMACAALCTAEIDAIREMFSAIPEIESIFVRQRDNSFYVTVVVAEKDYTVENRIYDMQLALMDRFGDGLFDFDIVARAGRQTTDVITPAGQVVFLRAAAA